MKQVKNIFLGHKPFSFPARFKSINRIKRNKEQDNDLQQSDETDG